MGRKVNKPKAINIEKYGDKTTLISNGTEITGDIRFSGALQIEGCVKGNIIAEEGLVRLADNGRVEGEIRAPYVVINGQVKGDVHSSEHLELAAKAEVSGNVYYKLIEMVMGAQVNGSLAYQDKALSPVIKTEAVKVLAKADDKALASN